MLNTLKALATPAVMQRITLLLNHVLASEPVATHRLKSHAGRCISLTLERWPSLLPPVPPLAFLVTPAGLLEWAGDVGDTAQPPTAADLQVRIDAANPAMLMVQGLSGQRPRIEVAGDAMFAADVSWLFENLRWDMQDDLARLVGEVPAREMTRFGGFLAIGLREVVQRLARLAPGASEPPAA
jgi:ubiquinone biosynthesis protein UbiJ